MGTTPSPAQSEKPGSNPFRGLVPYEQTDQLFARDADVQLVQSRFWASSATILFAGSGVGKSSFINAKLLPALRTRLGEGHVFAPKEWTKDDPTSRVKEQLVAIAANRTTRKGNVLVLDQFEEVFQYLTDVELLRSFGQLLASIVSEDSTYQTRILIAIREEFLAPLTIFDSFVPGILTNYYRLERVTADQVRLIIEKTVGLEGAQCDEGKLKALISDLSSVGHQSTDQDTAPLAPTASSDNPKSDLRMVHIDLPYLQIVCRRVWDREVCGQDFGLASFKHGDAPLKLIDYCRGQLKTFRWRARRLLTQVFARLKGPKERTAQGERGPFLFSYKNGDAPKELEAYCQGHLDVFTRKERYLLARAIAHLTGPHEAKKAVKVSDLAFEMKEGETEPLASILETLSKKDVRILRDRTENKLGQQPVKIYELYHDMYSQMLWKWREEQLARLQRTLIAKAILAATLCWFLILSPLWSTTLAWPSLKTRQGTKIETSFVLDMRNALAHSMLFRFIGDHLWREYTTKLSDESAIRQETEGALLYRLADPSFADQDIDSEAAKRLVTPARFLKGTFSLAPGNGQWADAAILEPGPDGKSDVIAATVNGLLVRWDGDHNVLNNSLMKVVDPLDPRHLASRQGFHTLCLSPNGQSAVVVWLPSDPASSSRSLATVHVDLVQTSNGVTKDRKDISVDLGSILGSAGMSAATRQRGALGAEIDPAFLAIFGARGTFSSDNSRFAVIVGDQLRVFDQNLNQKSATVTTGPQSYIDDLAFVDRPLANRRKLLLVSERSYRGSSLIRVFDLEGDVHELKTQQSQSVSLPPDARFVLGSKGMLAQVGGQWSWVLPDTMEPSPSENSLESYLQPQAFDDQRNLILSKDLSGTLVVSSWQSDHFESETLSISEPRQVRVQSRSITVASTSRLVTLSRFLTLDSTKIRLWDLSELGNVVDSLKTKPRSEPELWAFCNPDRKICATGNKKNQIWTVDGDRAHAPDLPWTVTLPHADGPRRMILSRSGTQLFAWYPDEVLYASKGDGHAKSDPRTNFLDAEFGPDKQLLTVITNDHVQIRDLKPPFESKWSMECNGCSLLHTSNDNGVILYSSTWIHRISPDRRSSIHRWLEGDSMWPHIISVAHLTRIGTVKPSAPNDNSKVFVDGSTTPLDFEAIDRMESENRRVSIVPTTDGYWNFAPCPPPADLTQQPDKSRTHRAMCEWERRTGRHLGSPPEP
jgi:hypothetical protein